MSTPENRVAQGTGGTTANTKVLVVGGTGVTGRLVREMLCEVGGIDLSYTSRRKPDDGPGNHFPLRFGAGRNEICSVLRNHDWVVNCTGPFEVYQDLVARACIDAGTGYIDVNDSIDARRAIINLDTVARQKGVSVLTGFGLCPGLSTALLMLYARTEGAEKVGEVQVDLNIGADQESGAASVESMFRTIRGTCREIFNGDITEVEPDPSSAKGKGICYECPDIDIVRNVFPATRSYSYYVEFQALPDTKLAKIRSSKLFAMPVISSFLARLGASATSRKARAKGSPRPTELSIDFRPSAVDHSIGDAEASFVRATGPSSYLMTATIASGAVVAVRDRMVSPGCRDLVGCPELVDPILSFAREAGIRIENSADK